MADFPADVQQFIVRHIESLAQLELLLLLVGDPERQWTAAEIAEKQSTSNMMSEALLQDLTLRNFAKQMGERYQYHSIDSASDELIRKLGETYRARRVAVTTEIYSKPVNKLKSFADAFRLRREP